DIPPRVLRLRWATGTDPRFGGGSRAGLFSIWLAAEEASSFVTDRVGPYEVVRELLRAPGALLAEARDQSGQPRLLQLARFRGALTDDDREKRQKQEKVVAQLTAELIGDSDIVVHAHGGADA